MVDLVEQAGDGAFVVPEGLDSVELKLTVPEGRGTEVAHALGVDPLDAQIRQIYFFDTPALELNAAGVVLRARRIQAAEHDCVVKLRPIEPAGVGPAWRKRDDMTIELDVVKGKSVCSASLKAVRRPERILETLRGEKPIRKLFTKDQRAFLAAHSRFEVPWDDVVALGPIFVLKLKRVPDGFPRKVAVELWRYPDNSIVVELSTRATPDEALEVGMKARELVESLGLRVEGEQTTKTQKALRYFARAHQ